MDQRRMENRACAFGYEFPSWEIGPQRPTGGVLIVSDGINAKQRRSKVEITEHRMRQHIGQRDIGQIIGNIAPRSLSRDMLERSLIGGGIEFGPGAVESERSTVVAGWPLLKSLHVRPSSV